MISIGDRIRAFGRSWILTTLGLYDEMDRDLLEVASTLPAPPPCPSSAPPVPAPEDDSDEYLVIGGGHG